MAITIAPINQYAKDWSQVESIAAQTEKSQAGTGLTLSSSSIWLADAEVIGRTTLTGKEVILNQLLPDQNPGLIDKTDVENTNVISVGTGGINLGETNTGSLFFQESNPQIEQGALTFSLDVNGSTESSNAGSQTLSVKGSDGISAVLDSNSPLLRRVNSSSPTLTTSSADSEIPFVQGSSKSQGALGLPSASISNTLSSAPAVQISDNTSSLPSLSPSSSVPVPIAFSPSFGLVYLVSFIVLKWLYRPFFCHHTIKL